jgi:hypothetical protein
MPNSLCFLFIASLRQRILRDSRRFLFVPLAPSSWSQDRPFNAVAGYLWLHPAALRFLSIHLDTSSEHSDAQSCNGMRTPNIWEPVLCTPILDVRAILAQQVIVFANFTELLAYGQTGIGCRTTRLSWDSLKITEVTDTFIKGEFWDLRREAMATFVVDLATGSHEGGIEE